MAIEDVIQQITIETAYLPPIVLDYPLKPGQGGPNPLLDMMKPKITVQTPGRAYQFHPWGDPGETNWPTVRNVGIVAALAVLAVIVWKL